MGKQMITVGIVTINDYKNYGNRLQNYALTNLLKSEGYNVLNGIWVSTKQSYISNSGNILIKCVKSLLPFSFVKPRITPSTSASTALLRERERRFADFGKTYSDSIEPIVTKTNRHALELLHQHGVSYFVVGSDQVWNPHYAGRDYEFLTFAPKDKRLSFAASIGADEIPQGQVKRFKNGLSKMKYLSVREQRAVEIVKELTGRDADLTLDPTLLLEPEKWQDAVKKPDIQVDSDYICTYFLGEVPEAVARFARETGLPLYALNSESSPELFVLDPGEFLYMIQNAAYVLTDSFHAVAFSIKFHKEFYVFDRKQKGVESMFSRIETITKRFNLENRIQNRDAIVEQPSVVHWEAIDQELLSEKTVSMQRLINAMETT